MCIFHMRWNTVCLDPGSLQAGVTSKMMQFQVLFCLLSLPGTWWSLLSCTSIAQVFGTQFKTSFIISLYDPNWFASFVRAKDMPYLCFSSSRSLVFTPLVAQGKESTCQARHTSLIPGSGRSSGEENDNPLQYSCLENSMDRGAWRATIYGVTKESDMI